MGKRFSESLLRICPCPHSPLDEDPNSVRGLQHRLPTPPLSPWSGLCPHMPPGLCTCCAHCGAALPLPFTSLSCLALQTSPCTSSSGTPSRTSLLGQAPAPVGSLKYCEPRKIPVIPLTYPWGVIPIAVVVLYLFTGSFINVSLWGLTAAHILVLPLPAGDPGPVISPLGSSVSSVTKGG